MFAEDLADEQKTAPWVITRRKTRKLIQCEIGFASRYEQSACWQAHRVLNDVPCEHGSGAAAYTSGRRTALSTHSPFFPLPGGFS
jgi:hypothetical protein